MAKRDLRPSRGAKLEPVYPTVREHRLRMLLLAGAGAAALTGGAVSCGPIMGDLPLPDWDGGAAQVDGGSPDSGAPDAGAEDGGLYVDNLAGGIPAPDYDGGTHDGGEDPER